MESVRSDRFTYSSSSEMNGFDFMFALRKNARLARIPVVALTGEESDENAQEKHRPPVLLPT